MVIYKNTKRERLEHDMLVDGKYLHEDCIPQLISNLSKIKSLVPESLHTIFNEIIEKSFDQFNRECAAYDRSTMFEQKRVIMN